MRQELLTNERGVTLTELIVAMAMSSVLMVIVVSGSLFLRKQMNLWRERDLLVEELAFLSKTVASSIASSHQVEIESDTVTCQSTLLGVDQFILDNRRLLQNGRPLNRSGVTVDSFCIARFVLPTRRTDTILTTEERERHSGFYELTISVSDGRGNTESLRSVVRNDHEYFKNKPAKRPSAESAGLLTD